HRSCPWCRCTARRSRRPFASFCSFSGGSRREGHIVRIMLLMTGATGLVGSTLLRRLVADGTQVRCLVRDPRRLGTQRVRVQIALGDLTDPPSFRNALRGVRTVVHLAGSIRDQPSGSIEELDGIATWRMVEAAGRGRVACQPIWAQDVADCVIGALRAPPPDRHARYELAGPQTLTLNELLQVVVRSLGRHRPLLHVPTPLVSRGLRALQAVSGP